MEKNLVPAYTEEDILETVVELQKDMGIDTGNELFRELKEKSPLFMGCRYDDWLFRFFIRTVSNQPFKNTGDSRHLNFIGDDFDSLKGRELACFLRDFGAEVFYSGRGNDFVDLLFREMEKYFPGDIIPAEEFPVTAFISFHSADREAASCLAANLTADGVKVWFDTDRLRPGDRTDKAIVTSIEKCPVFIPLISENAKNFRGADDKRLRYHIHEWEWAYKDNVAGKNPRVIMPVNIDGTDWLYAHFSGDIYSNVRDGGKNSDYEKLKKRLLEIQESGVVKSP